MIPGDDVIVDFDGVEHVGTVIANRSNGWVQVRIITDPLENYGGTVVPPLRPQPPLSEVIVRVSRVRLVEG